MGEATITEIELWYGIVEAWKKLERASDLQLRKLGLGLQEYRVLRCLYVKGACTMTEASRAVIMSPGGLTPLIDSMEKKGLVVRERSSKDRRIINLSITEKGKKVLADSNVTLMDFIRRLLENKSGEDVHSVFEFMRSVSERAGDL